MIVDWWDSFSVLLTSCTVLGWTCHGLVHSFQPHSSTFSLRLCNSTKVQNSTIFHFVFSVTLWWNIVSMQKMIDSASASVSRLDSCGILVNAKNIRICRMVLIQNWHLSFGCSTFLFRNLLPFKKLFYAMMYVFECLLCCRNWILYPGYQP